ncbi:30S ribosomal protein S8 [Candidatus Daviesbacteria bacterium]|nr:30S ribosomal protein S8 [Candidatus Daviesbacteria bacterium]
MNDYIADTLIRIKNGYRVGKESVDLRYSKLILNLVKLLEKEGYVGKVDGKEKGIRVELKYNGRLPALTEVKRVSRPSLRVYKGVKDLPRVLNGLGIAVVSTPQGLMTDKEARKLNAGGEVLALIW